MKAIFGDDEVSHIACEDIGEVAAKTLLDACLSMKDKNVALVGRIASANRMKDALDRASGVVRWRVWVSRWVVFGILSKEFWEMFSVSFWFGFGKRDADGLKVAVQDL